MNKLIRLYNQNRGLILMIVVVLALIIIIIQVLNSLVKSQKISNIITKEQINSSTNQSTTISQSNVSVITGEKVENTESNKNTVKKFVDYCNSGNLENAYNMLTNECKQLLYPSISDFKTKYYDKIFYINRMYTLENWYSSSKKDTYYIKYIEDILASGNANSSENVRRLYNSYSN